jgi:hypothetical protein
LRNAPPGFAASDDDIYLALNNLLYLTRFQINSRKTAGCGNEQLAPIGRVGILMKVKALAAGFARKSDNAMLCVRINPFRRGSSAKPLDSRVMMKTIHYKECAVNSASKV